MPDHRASPAFPLLHGGGYDPSIHEPKTLHQVRDALGIRTGEVFHNVATRMREALSKVSEDHSLYQFADAIALRDVLLAANPSAQAQAG